MKETTLARAQEISSTINNLSKARRIFLSPYPNFLFTGRRWFKKRSFSDTDNVVSFAGFDKETGMQMKTAIMGVIEKRTKELREEMEKL